MEEKSLTGFYEGVKSHLSLLTLTVVMAACSISYELLIAHSLALLAANAVIWYSLVIGCFLLGMGIGSLIVDWKWSDSTAEESWNRLISIELVLSFVGFLAIPLLHSAHSLYSYLDYWNYTNVGLVLFFGTALFKTVLIGILTGVELPLLITIGKFEAKKRNITNLVLGFDYFGSLIGAVVFPLLLVPYLSTFTIGALIALVNLFAACFVIKKTATSKRSFFYPSFAALLFLSLTVTTIYESSIEQFYLKRFYCYRLLSRSLDHYLSSGSEYPDILRIQSPYQRIDLLHDMEGDGTDHFVKGVSTKFSEHPDWPHNRLLFLNGDWQFHSNHEEVYHEWFAHVPIINTGKVPKKVLVLGGGDGILIRELLRYKEIESIKHVDLDEELIELAKTNETFLHLNEGALLDSRVDAHIGDGMQYVRTADESFDAIYIDFPTPTDYELSKLYSREFYTFVRRRLNPRGFMVFDSVSTGALHLPDENGVQHLKDDNRWDNFYHTLRAAGFTRIVPFNSTLGFTNDEALEMARNVYGDEEGKNRLRSYLLQRQQGFIMVGLPSTLFGGGYKELSDGDFHVLNGERYALSFAAEYPEYERIDHGAVNSIFRPRLAIMPIWNARLPF